MKTQKQQGFTLIELVVVIVILGILAAVAAPKFVDLTADAKNAKLAGAEAALKSASTLVHAKALLEGKAHNSDTTITIDGETVKTAYGYVQADVDSVVAVLDMDISSLGDGITSFSTDYGIKAVNGKINIFADQNNLDNCYITYTAATSSKSPDFDSTACN